MFCLSVMHCSLGRLSDRISLALELHQRRQEEEDTRDEIKMEWQLAAMIIDRCALDETLFLKHNRVNFRFLLWIFILATITATFR